MIVNNLDILCVSRRSAKAHAGLIINADAVLACAIALKGL
jgi:hypothetical protein